jgi:putative aldouronate transport system permease protein
LNKLSLGERTFDIINSLMLILLCVAMLYPFLYIAFASFSSASLLVAHRGLLFMPLGFSLEAYKAVFDNPMIGIGYRNTILYVVAGTCINIVMTSLGAYVLSRRNLYFKNSIMFMIVITMFFHGGLIPSYLLVNNLGLLDTPWALLIPAAINTWNLIIMRTSFQAVPASLEESAKIDGANDIVILMRVVIPLSMPVIAVMILFYSVGHWNSWFSAMMYIRTRELNPLQVILREILITNSNDNMLTDVGASDKFMITETIKYATVIIATIPILALYPFLQRYFVKGVMIGSLKE